MSQAWATWEVLVVLGVLITLPLPHMQKNEPPPLLHCMYVIVYFCDACAEMYIKVWLGSELSVLVENIVRGGQGGLGVSDVVLLWFVLFKLFKCQRHLSSSRRSFRVGRSSVGTVAAVQPIRIPVELEALDSRQSLHWIYIMYHHKIITNPLSESLCFSLFFHPVFNQSSPSLSSPHLFLISLQPEDSHSWLMPPSRFGLAIADVVCV